MQVSDKPNDLFARFEPWLPTLRAPTPGWAAFPDDVFGPRVVWFRGGAFFDSDAAKEPLDGVCEALSLLTLLARVDFQAWKKTVLKIWPDDWRFMELLEKLAPSERFVVGFGVSELNNQSIKSMARFQDYNASEECPSDEYMRLREDLETVIRARGRGDEEDEKDHLQIRVTVELDCSNGRGRAAAAMLQRTLNHVKEEHAMTLSRSTEGKELAEASKRPFFTITNVAFATTVGVKLGMAGLKLLQELTQLGIRLSHLPPLKINPTVRQVPEFLQAVRDIVCLDDAEKVGARTVTINDQYAPDLTRSLLTTVQHSSKVQALEIDLGNGDGDQMFADQSHVWTWVALTVFSKYANHNIDTLELNVEGLQQVEVDAVRLV